MNEFDHILEVHRRERERYEAYDEIAIFTIALIFMLIMKACQS